MKANITLKLDATLLREIRVMAAEEGTSISALLTARLEQIVREARHGNGEASIANPVRRVVEPTRAFARALILTFAHVRANWSSASGPPDKAC